MVKQKFKKFFFIFQISILLSDDENSEILKILSCIIEFDNFSLIKLESVYSDVLFLTEEMLMLEIPTGNVPLYE